MHFQQALVQAMDTQQVSLSELAARTGANPRWLTAITTNAEWMPKLDTVLRLCYALRINVLDFLTLAEAGSRGQAPSSKLQAPSSKLQAPSSKLQAPSSKREKVTTNASLTWNPDIFPWLFGIFAWKEDSPSTKWNGSPRSRYTPSADGKATTTPTTRQ